MQFLRECASRLDAGEDAACVMVDLRARYTTVRCVNVKACLVRGMCAPTEEHREACRALVARRPDLAPSYDDATGTFARDVDRTLLSDLPPRCSENVRRFTVSRNELRECKRVSARNAIVKNKFSERVRGRELLRHAREVLATAGACASVPELTFALMLATGRRECEILNGRSAFAPHTEHSMTFRGQAKKRGPADEIVIPTLARADDVAAALVELRKRQAHATLTNRETSLRYQSYLSRSLARAAPWSQCRKVHSLRGVYACMVTRLFDWGAHSHAFVTMCVLGHTGLTESLVYTPYHVGDDFGDEPSLGRGHFTEWLTPEESRCDGAAPRPPCSGEAPTPS